MDYLYFYWLITLLIVMEMNLIEIFTWRGPLEQSLLLNWLCGYVCGYVAELSASFSILFSSRRCTSSRQIGFLCTAAQLCKFRRISVTSRRSLIEWVSNERIWIASSHRLRCIEMGNLRNLMKLLSLLTSSTVNTRIDPLRSFLKPATQSML